MRVQKGSITVMLLLVLCAVVMAVTLVVEAARIRIAEGQAKRAVDTAVFSALSSYDQDTKDDYGLFYRYGASGLEVELQEAVEKTLLIHDGSDAWQPYEYQVDGLKVRVMFPLNDKDSLKHQIVEYMKYRGPVELVGETAEKLSAFFAMQSTAKVLKEDLAVDKKLKRMVTEVEALKKEVAMIQSFSLEDHRALCREAASWVSLFEAIEELEQDIAQLQETIEMMGYEGTENYQSALEAKYISLTEKQNEISAEAEALYECLAPVVAAHESALESCRRLKILGPEVAAAIKRAEAVMKNEKGAIADVKSDLAEKYKKYKQYADPKALDALEQQLDANLSILKPQLHALGRIKDRGEEPGNYPAVFTDTGYGSCSFEPEPFPGGDVTAGGTPVKLDWGVVEGLLAELKQMKESLRQLTSTEDEGRGAIEKCPGGGSGAETKAEEPKNTGDAYDQANDTVAGALENVGGGSQEGGPDNGALIEGLADGALSLTDELYDGLLINEYALLTFNNRVDPGGHEKHLMSETEVEYILIGSRSPMTNAALAQGEILAWRTVFNAVSFSVLCNEVKTAIDGAAVGLNAATGIPYPLWKGTLTGLLAMLEACADVSRMYQGESIPMVKYTPGELSIMQMLEDALSRLGVQKGSAGDGSRKSDAPSSSPKEGKALGKKADGENLLVDYTDHLRAMLMYRTLLGQGNTALYRIQDLIYTNIKHTRGNYNPAMHFNFIEVDARLIIKSFFPNLNGIKSGFRGIPMRHVLTIECGRGY